MKRESLSRRSPMEISLGVGIGTFLGFMPLQGIKTPLVGVIKVIFPKVNIVSLFLASSVISLPPVIPFVYYFDYWLGTKILSRPLILTLSSFRDIGWKDIGGIFLSLFLGGLVAGSFLGILTFSLSGVFLRWRRKKSPQVPHLKHRR